MSHNAHDVGCAARESEKCDCKQGRERRSKAKAVKFMKRHKGKVPIIEGKVVGFDWLDRRLGRDKDNCERCKGEKGGVRGNENIVDGEVLCDYCHADKIRRER